jgi:hypothetical protein
MKRKSLMLAGDVKSLHRLFVSWGFETRYFANWQNGPSDLRWRCQESALVRNSAGLPTPNRLILRGPAGDLPPVTAEATGSSPVVPAIFFKHLQP